MTLEEKEKSGHSLSSESSPSVESNTIQTNLLFEDALSAAFAWEKQDQTIASLEKAVEAFQKAKNLLPTHRRPYEELSRLFRQLERFGPLAELLKQWAEKAASSMTEKSKLLLEAAHLYQHPLHQDQNALLLLQQALRESPDSIDILDRLLVFYEKLYRFPDVVQILQKKIALLTESKAKITLLEKVALLFQEKFSNPAEAMKAYEQILELSPSHLVAKTYLKSQYEKRREFEKLAHLLQKEKQSLSGEEKRKVSIELARLVTEKVRNVEWAISCWQAVLEQDPKNEESLIELEKLYEREKNWDQLGVIWSKQEQMSADSSQKIVLLQKMGLLFTEKRKDEAKAIDAWKKVLLLEPENRRAIEAIKKLYVEKKKWDELESFYAVSQKYEEFARVLERQLEQEQGFEKAEVAYRLGILYQQKLKRPDRAIRALEQALLEHHKESMELLISLYEKAKDSEKLARVLEVQILQTQEVIIKKQRYIELARLKEETLKDKQGAYALYLQAFQLENDVTQTKDIERLAKETNDYQSLAEVYEEILHKTLEGSMKLSFLCSLADIYENKTFQIEKAIEKNETILQLFPEKEQALDALIRLYKHVQNHVALLAKYQQKLKHTFHFAQRCTLLYQIAQLQELQLLDIEAARQSYQILAHENPEELLAWEGLARVCRERKDYRGVKEALEKQLGLLQQAEAFQKESLLFQLAQTLESHLDQKEESFSYYQQILLQNPYHEAAQHVEELLPTFTLKEPAILLLISVYEQTENWGKLVSLLQKQLEQMVVPEEKARVLSRLGDIWKNKLEQKSLAFSAYQEAIICDPSWVEIRKEFESLASSEKRLDELASFYIDLAHQKSTPEIWAKTLFCDAARLSEEVLQKPAQASSCYENAFSMDPHDFIILQHLEKLFTAMQQYDKLIDVYQKQQELISSPEQREKILLQKAILLEEKLQRKEEAIQVYEEILWANSSSKRALSSLEKLLSEKERFSDLCELYRNQLAVEKIEAAQIDIKQKLAKLYEHFLHDPQEALLLYEELLQIDSSQKEACVAIERFLEKPDFELQAATVFESFYQKHKNNPEQLSSISTFLARSYEIWLRHAVVQSERIHWLCEKAHFLQEYEHKDLEAFSVYIQAFLEDPSQIEVQEKVEQLAKKLSAWDRVISFYVQGAEQTSDVETKINLWQKAALLEEQEQRQEKAAQLWTLILEKEENHGQALVALERIYSQTKNEQALMDILQKKMLWASEEEQVSTKLSLASLYQSHLKDEEKAIQLYQDVLLSVPYHKGALAAIKTIFQKQSHRKELAEFLTNAYQVNNDFQSLASVYQTLLQKEVDPLEREMLYQKQAYLVENSLQDQKTALQIWTQAFIENPNFHEAQEQVERLVFAQGLFLDFVKELERGIASKEGTAPLPLLRSLASVYERGLSQFSSARQTHEFILQIHAEEQESIDALIRIAEKQGDIDGYVAFLQKQLSMTITPEKRALLLLKIGSVYHQRLQEVDKAITSFQEVLLIEPENEEALSALEGLYLSSNRWKELLALYERKVGLLLDPNERSACYRNMARLVEEKLQDPQAAIAFWNQVAQMSPDDEQTLIALTSLYEKAEQWFELTEVLEKRAHRSLDLEEQADFYQKQAILFEEKLGETHRALQVFYVVLQKKPTSLVAWRAVFRIERGSQNWKELVETYHAFLQISVQAQAKDEEIIYAHVSLAEIYQNHLLDIEQAAVNWQKVLTLDADHFQALISLEAIFLQQERFEEVVIIVEKQLTLHLDPAARIEKKSLLASLSEHHFGNKDKALQIYQEILFLDASYEFAAIQVERIYREKGAFSLLAEFLLGQAERTKNPVDNVSILQKVAVLFEQELLDLAKAFWVLLAAFHHEPTSVAIQVHLERLAKEAHLEVELASEYQNQAQQLESTQTESSFMDGGSPIFRLWSKASELYQSSGDADTQPAVYAAEKALRYEPENKTLLDFLIAAYAHLRNWVKLATTLEKAITIELQPQRKVELLLEMAPLYEFQLENPSQAQKYYEYALDLIPDEPEVLRSLERLYQKSGNVQKLLFVLQKRGERAKDIPSFISLLYRVAELQEQQTKEWVEAITTYERILEQDPNQMRAILALQSLYEKTNQKEALIRMLERQILCEEDPKKKILVSLRLATTWETLFSRFDQASNVLEQALQNQPEAGSDSSTIQLYVELKRLYQIQERYEDLALLYRRQLAQLSPIEQKVALAMDLAVLYETKLLDAERAISAYQDVLALDQQHLPAFWALGSLYESQGALEKAVLLWGELTHKLKDTKQKAELHQYVGVFYQEKLGALDQAEQEFVEALSLVPGNIVSIQSLLSLYEQQGFFIKAIQTLLYLEEHSPLSKEKANVFVKIGHIYAHNLQEPEQAQEMMEKALEFEPNHQEALDFLQEFYYKRKMWRLLSSVLEQLLKWHGSFPKQGEWHFRLAQAYEQVDNTKQALYHYQKAQQLVSQHQEDKTQLPIEGELAVGALLMKEQKWKEAEDAYQSCIQKFRNSEAKQNPEGMHDSEIAKIYHQLGLIALAQELLGKAVTCFQKALQIDPEDRLSFNALLEIFRTQKSWIEVVSLQQNWMLQIASVEEKVKILQEIGEIQQEKMQQKEAAIASFEAALRLAPGHLEILHKLFAFYSQEKNFRKAVEILLELAKTEPVPFRQGKLYHIAATLYRDHLQSTDEAMEFLNRALDCYFRVVEQLDQTKLAEALKSFVALDELCTKRKDWPNQERSYRNMLKRLPPSGFESVAVMLWNALGEVYRSRLKNIPAAISAFEVAQDIDPSSIARQEILADLYLLAGPDYMQKAFAQQQKMIQLRPFTAEPYRTLKVLYQKQNVSYQNDAVYGLSATLSFLGLANEEERQFLLSHKPVGQHPIKNVLSDSLWTQHLYHPTEDRAISSIFAALASSVALLRSEEHKQFQLKRKERQEISKNTDVISKILFQVQKILQISMPIEFYFRPELDVGLRLANTREKDQLIPSVVIGNQILRMKEEQELWVQLGLFCTTLRAEHYLRFILPTYQELAVVLFAAIRLVMPHFALPDSYKERVPAFEALLRPLLSENTMSHLQKVVPALIQAGKPLNINTWMKSVDLTSHRAAMLLSGNLPLVVKQMEQASSAILSSQEQMGELLAFIASPSYYILRKELGLV